MAVLASELRVCKNTTSGVISGKDYINLLSNDNDFLVKSVYCIDNSPYYGYRDGIENAIVFTRRGPIMRDLYSYKNCIIIHSSGSTEGIRYEKDGNLIYINLSNHLELVQELMSKHGIDVPTIVSENKYRYNNHYDYNIMRTEYNPNKVLIGEYAIIGGQEFIPINADKLSRPKFLTSVGGVRIGDGCVIGNRVTIYRGITENTIIDPGVIIPDNVIIHAGAHITAYPPLHSFNEYY